MAAFEPIAAHNRKAALVTIVEMLGRLTRKWRWRAAILLAVLYALCLTGSTAALAFNTATEPAHGLADDNHGLGTIHIHQDGLPHHQNNGDDNHGHADKCCGLFCLSAIAPAIDFIAGPQPLVAAVAARLAVGMTGRGSDRIDRPPRSRLSL